ncbi:MAG: AAA family ATPase [Alphaproteobacteria bacterium]
MNISAHNLEPKHADPASHGAPASHGETVRSATPAVRLVPRISIQAFCETPDFSAIIEEASNDRRLARAHVGIQTGGIAAAVEYYTSAPTPNLVVVESSAQRTQMLVELDRLASVCDDSAKIIVVGHVNDISLYRELVNQGVNDYVVAPFTVLQIIDVIAKIYDDPSAGQVGRSIAFVGAKGGCGSSTIAHNVGWVVSEILSENAIIADLDLAFGTLGLDFNQDPPQGVADALGAIDRLDETLLDRLLAKCTDKLNLFTAPSTLDRDYNFEAQDLETVLTMVRGTVPCIILDVPHLWSDWSRETLLAADEIVITAEPDLANLRNAKNLMDFFKSKRANDPEPHLVLNRVGMPRRPEISIKDFIDALSITPTLEIPFDPRLFGTAANNGQMIGELQAKSRVAHGFQELAQVLTGRSGGKAPSKSLFAPLLEHLKSKKS